MLTHFYIDIDFILLMYLKKLYAIKVNYAV